MQTRFSQRLDGHRPENALTAAASQRRESGLPILDLTESNPTNLDLAIVKPDVPDPATGDWMHTDGTDALNEAFRRATKGPYVPDPRGLPRARRAVAEGYAAAGHAVDAERVILTASSSESYSFLWKLLCDPGDTVLVPEPSYPLFEYLARLDGITPLPYRLTHDGTRTGQWRLDLDSVEEALAAARTRVGALVLVSPNNPTGSVLQGDDLLSLDRRAAADGFALVADEVFSDYVDMPTPQQIRCLAAESTAALTFSLGGLSKSCGFPQLKLGWTVVGGPSAAVGEALDRLDLIADTYLSVNSPVQAALPELLKAGAVRRRLIAARVADNRRWLVAMCEPESPLSVLRSEGGWSAIVRLPAVLTDEQWALALIEQDGVLVHPGYFFDLRGATFVVVSLLPSSDVFREGMRRLAARVSDVLR